MTRMVIPYVLARRVSASGAIRSQRISSLASTTTIYLSSNYCSGGNNEQQCCFSVRRQQRWHQHQQQQQRHTIATTTFDNKADLKFQETATQRLLLESSSWDQEMRHQALQSLRYWTSNMDEKKSHDGDKDALSSSSSFTYSWKLWNRLVEEDVKEQDFCFVEKQPLFHRILFLWGKLTPPPPPPTAASIGEDMIFVTPQEMLNRIKEYSSKGIIQPTDKTYNIIINALPQLMAKMRKHQQQHNTDMNNNNGITNAEEFADLILRQMIVDPSMPNPTMITFAIVLNIWASSTHPKLVRRIQEIEQIRKDLERTVTTYPNKDEDYKSTLIYKSILIKAYAKAGRPHDCEALWEDWWQDYNENPTEIEPPNIQVASSILQGWSKYNHPNRAESFLRHLIQMHDEALLKESPNVFSYTVVLDAWAKSNMNNGPERAESILQELIDHVSLQPNVVAWTSVIQAYGKRGDIDKAQLLLQNMILAGYQPNTITFNGILQGVQDLRQASRLLQSMKDIARNRKWDCQPDCASYSTLIRLCAKHKASKGAENVWKAMIRDGANPDSIAYNNMLNVYAKSGYPLQAESLLFNEMIENYLKYTNNHMGAATPSFATSAATTTTIMPAKPEIVSFNTVLSAWGDSGNIQRAEALFKKLEELQHPTIRGLLPNVVTYTILLNCWSKARVDEETMIKRVRSIFQEMESNTKLQPNLISYSTLCKCFAKCGLGQSAMAAVTRMRKEGIEPNATIYAQVLHALAEQCVRSHADDDEKAILDDIENMLREMVEIGLKPTIPMFSAWLKAINASSSMADKEKWATEVVDAMKSVGLRPNDVVLRQLKQIQGKSNKTQS